MSETQEYSIWLGIIQRCCNPNQEGYKKYGGRGITICDRWLNSFEAFFADMGLRPSPEHSIDRFPDQGGPYSPGNCRWATRKQQANNMRTNVILEYKGERHTLTEWADIKGIPRSVLRTRYSRGWSVAEALDTPARPIRKSNP
jgi:hypothetical protein